MVDSSRGADSTRGGVGEPHAGRRHDDTDTDTDTGSGDERSASTMVIEVDGFDAVESNKRRRQILDRVSWVITDTVRTTDAVYRDGASGFCVLMARTPENEAVEAAKRLRVNVESMPLLAEAGVTVTVSVAAGSETDLPASIARAEQAIARPHEANRVIRADDDPPG